MGLLWQYFGTHRWQRRLLTLALAGIAGVLVAWLLWPRAQMWRAVRGLDSPDIVRRGQAVRRVVELGRRYPNQIGQVESKLDSADDEQFTTLANVLTWLGRFNEKTRRGYQLDRYWEISLRCSTSREAQLIFLREVIRAGRDDRYVREMIATAAGAKDPRVRATGGLLAAMLGDDDTLRRLLGDADPDVRGVATIDAALTGREKLRATVAPMLADEESDFAAACAAYALWTWDANKEVAEAVLSADAAGQTGRRDLLLCALVSPCENSAARALAQETVAELLARARRRKEVPSAMVFVAAGRLEVHQAIESVNETIRAVLARKAKATVADAESLAAAMQAARRLGAADVQPATRVLVELWNPVTAMIMILDCEALGQMLADAPAPKTPLNPMETLRRGVQYQGTPLASAAAAVALFAADPGRTEDYLRQVCESDDMPVDDMLACNYVAWQLQSLARRSSSHQAQYRAAAEKIADSFTTGGSFSVGVPTTGAMLLAYLNGGTDRAASAAGRIARKLSAAGENVVLAGTYRCALLVLGRSEYRQEVINLLEEDKFPRDRAVTALLLSDDPVVGLDHILGQSRFDFVWIDRALAGRLLARAIEQVAPSLPAYDFDASAGPRALQARILRDAYLLQRRRFERE